MAESALVLPPANEADRVLFAHAQQVGYACAFPLPPHGPHISKRGYTGARPSWHVNAFRAAKSAQLTVMNDLYSYAYSTRTLLTKTDYAVF